jgi:integrase
VVYLTWDITMGTKKSFRLWKRKDRKDVYYVQFPGEKWVSTGCTDRNAAESHANDMLAARRMAKITKMNIPDDKLPAPAMLTLGEYAKDFFIWDKCPHCRRVLENGGQIGPEHAKRQRRLLERFIIGNGSGEDRDSIAGIRLSDIRKNDCYEFRSRLVSKLNVNIQDRDDPVGKRTVNSVMTSLSTIFSEAMEREILESNPAAKMLVKYRKPLRGTFNEKELRKMFPANLENLGPWDDFQTKCMFLVAGSLGMRRNEVRALRWQNVDLEHSEIRIVEAFKSYHRKGSPKWDKERVCALPTITAQHLKKLKNRGYRAGDDDHVFVRTPVDLPRKTGSTITEDGHIGTTLWQNSWKRGMKKLKIDREGRGLVPHSLRHSLATELRARGVSDLLLKKGLGWSSDSMVEHYSDHMDADHFRGQAAEVDKLLG